MSGGGVTCILLIVVAGLWGAVKASEGFGWPLAPCVGAALGAMVGFAGMLAFWIKGTYMQGEIGLAALPLAVVVGAPVGGLVGLGIGFGIHRLGGRT